MKHTSYIKGGHIISIYALITSASAIILAIVWAAELAGLAPCPLCLQQRYAYYIALGLGVYGGFCALRFPIASRGLLVVLAIIFAANAVFGIYHSGVEYGWWAGPLGCAGTGSGSGASAITSTQDLLAQLNRPFVSCERPSFRFLSLSLAGYNALASFGLSALALYGAKK